MRTVNAPNSFGRPKAMTYAEYVSRWTGTLTNALTCVADSDKDTQAILDMISTMTAIASRRFEELYEAQNGEG